ncbi:SidA/IucD/PvdA family monooxygenase [Bermanella marisrubri]|uniref:Putative siderophore biosynthetic enzyme n=1 Tax=Bermanella marisrubri TaxID=207949 RepID=Q1N2D7_9GAMM|nr:SidA/IucD/PvdA family monooxygenase [Bermanella marisrubri]EAT12470.1 putative siderophore biosynthetic enzyme [Oceanobacter sp. RED65] [Bermanella marisrubri]QIZ85548.1 SidA/IucD/PvdA family monooxygenase [Bermanella marisrubri]
MTNNIFDFIAIGLGPFNLGLACLTNDIDDLNGLFLEQKNEFNWHPDMMLESAHLQTPFMSDLVTLADPTHELSFLNYAKQTGRLYSFYIRENFFLMRREYNQYCRWAIDKLNHVRFNHRVETIEYNESDSLYCISVSEVDSKQNIVNSKQLYTKKLVLGTGPSPWLPEAAKSLETSSLSLHSSQYLQQKSKLQQQASITIIGSGQSAAEIYYDLLQDIDTFGYELNWVTRSPRFFPLEYSKLTLEMTSPEYVDYFYNLPSDKRDELIATQKHLYKGINTDLINDIYDLLYIKRLNSDFTTRLLTNSTLKTCRAMKEAVELGFTQDEQDKDYTLTSEGIVFATGYAYQPPQFLQSISEHIQWDNKGRFAVNRNYSIDHNADSIFIQNAELHTHGFVSPDLGMACYRNSYIIKELLGYEYYPIEKRIAFQDFSAPVNESVEDMAVLTS